MLKYCLDMHTHTVASGHAYTTFLENIREASSKGLKLLGTSDHGPAMPGGAHIFYFWNLKVLPREYEGVILLRGCESNIIDFDGNLDLEDDIFPRLDYVIASLHTPCIRPGSVYDNTRALVNAMESKKIDIIGHAGNPSFPILEEVVVKKAKENDVIIEINNSSFSVREGSAENCTKIAELCKKFGVKVILSSDAHTCFQIGQFGKAEDVMKKINMPEELIMNTDENKIIKYLKNKGKLSDLKLD